MTTMRLAFALMPATLLAVLSLPACRKSKSPQSKGAENAAIWPPTTRLVLARARITVEVEVADSKARAARLEFDGTARAVQPIIRGARVSFVDVDVTDVRHLAVVVETATGSSVTREWDVEIVAGERTFAARVAPHAGIVGSTVGLGIVAGAAAPAVRSVLLDAVGDGRFVDLGPMHQHRLPLTAAGVATPRVCLVADNGAGHVLDLDVRLAAFDVTPSPPEQRVLALPGGAARAVAWSGLGVLALTDRLLAVDLHTGDTTLLTARVPAGADALAAGTGDDVFVASSAASTVTRLVAQNGTWAPDPRFGIGGNIGGRGSAPGRFLGALSLAVIEHDGVELLAVADAQRRDVQLFDEEGRAAGVAASQLAGVVHMTAAANRLIVATGQGHDRGLLAMDARGQRVPIADLLGELGAGGAVHHVAVSGTHVILLAADTLTVHTGTATGGEITRVLPVAPVAGVLAIAEDDAERVRVLHDDARGLAIDTHLPEPPGHRPADTLGATIADGRAGSLAELRARLVGGAAVGFDQGASAAGFAAAARALFQDLDAWREVERSGPDRVMVAAHHVSTDCWIRFVLRPDAAGRWAIER